MTPITHVKELREGFNLIYEGLSKALGAVRATEEALLEWEESVTPECGVMIADPPADDTSETPAPALEPTPEPEPEQAVQKPAQDITKHPDYLALRRDLAAFAQQDKANGAKVKAQLDSLGVAKLSDLTVEQIPAFREAVLGA